MWFHACGASAVAEKMGNENMNVRFLSYGAVSERHVVALQIFFPALLSDSCCFHVACTVENGCGLLSRQFSFFFFPHVGLVSSSTEVSKMLWWRMIMKNWTQVAILVWGCDRHLFHKPLFYDIVHPKPVLSFMILCTPNQYFLLDLLLFFNFSTLWGSTAISSCSYIKAAWASFDWYGAMTFLLKNRNKKGQKNWKRASSIDSHTSLIAAQAEPHTVCRCSSAAAPKIWIFNLMISFRPFLIRFHSHSSIGKMKYSFSLCMFLSDLDKSVCRRYIQVKMCVCISLKEGLAKRQGKMGYDLMHYAWEGSGHHSIASLSDLQLVVEQRLL